MNKYLKSSLMGAVSGIASYLIWDKSRKVNVFCAILGFLVTLWVIKDYKKQKKTIIKHIKKDIEDKAVDLEIAGIKPVIKFADTKVTKPELVGIQDINLYDTTIPLTKRIFGLILNHCNDDTENSWKRCSVDGVVDLFQQDIDGKLVKTSAINHDSEDNFIHVLNNPRKGYRFITLFVKVPAYVARGSYATPKLKDYKNRLKEYIDEFWSAEGITSRKPNVFQKGFKSVMTKPGEESLKVDETHLVPIEKFIEISEEEMNKYSTIKEDGTQLPDGLSKMVSFFDDPDELEKAGYESVSQFAAVEIEVMDGTKSGIDLPHLIKFMRGLVNWKEFNVTQINGDAETLIGPFVFHPGTNLGEVYGTDLSIHYSYFGEEIYEI